MATHGLGACGRATGVHGEYWGVWCACLRHEVPLLVAIGAGVIRVGVETPVLILQLQGVSKLVINYSELGSCVLVLCV